MESQGEQFNSQDTDEEHGINENKFESLVSRLHLDKYPQKLKSADFLQITAHSFVIQSHAPCAEQDLVQTFLQKLLMMDYSARYTTIKETNEQQQLGTSDSTEKDTNVFDEIFCEFNLPNVATSRSEKVHPMDVQMAVFHCADNFLKQLMVTKLSQCQYALPLLVPNPSTQQIEFPLWTFRQINKSWKIINPNNKIITKTQPMYKAETPMVAFFRFGSVSSSKSQLMSNLINDKHNMFFHRNCKGSSRSRVLMDGVVEIAWYFPSGKATDQFTDCVAFCNLHGDAGDNEKQLNILTKMASVNVVLMPQLDRNDKNMTKIQSMFKDLTPVICLLAENNSHLTVKQQRIWKIGLKNRNQKEVIEDLSRAIKEGLLLSSSQPSSVFRLEHVARFSDIRVDEDDDEDCKAGKKAGEEMITLLKDKDLTEIKESFLPCQGKLWHQWCQKNKELHRPQRNQTEKDLSAKKTELKKIRKNQQACDISEFVKLFLIKMNPINVNDKKYFLKWLILHLHECTSEVVSTLFIKYNNNWSNRSHLLSSDKLEAISESIQAANFGLEHILREIGQIYESCLSVKKNKEGMPLHFSSLPTIAAEIMISGFPLELMDGDAAHVPLIWITAVLDELIKKLGNQRVFVLSVLGIESSGKSTMLNTMFGLQFAVSAGRCTRGAFMQLIKVSDEMNTEMKFDYILVVDTEGLCSSELNGRETIQHDNELATFVIGLGNVTLINIFGENPVRLQEILQIVGQAFLRMKMVKLNPSCMFVHQNVDNTADEKLIQARRKLQKELDNMIEIAAKDEVCDAQCFNDVIQLDLQNDVKYFPNLWEGNPPMAPPNPNYCESVQDLKKAIISKASISNGMWLTYFKYRCQALWEALLNENFVFSFKDCLEISVYRRLETEYNKWTWNLRCALLEIENTLLNRIENEKNVDLQIDPQAELKEISENVTKTMSEYFENNKDASILIQWKASFELRIKELQQNLVRETKRKINEVLQQRNLREQIDARKTHHENTLFEKSRESAFMIKKKANDEETLKKEFNSFWKQWVAEIKKDMPPVSNINVLGDMKQLLSEIDEGFHAYCWNESRECRDITSVPSYSDYIVFKSSRSSLWNFSSCSLKKEDEDNIRMVVTAIAKETDEMIMSKPIVLKGYNIMYVQELIHFIRMKVKQHEVQVKYVFKKQFTIDLTLHIGKRASKIFTDRHRLFKDASDAVDYFEKKKEEYYSIFQKYCHGTKSSAIFGEIICNKLKEPIQQSAYKNTARELADEIRANCDSLNGNRSKLEKHILKRLAEKENFDMYMNYIHNPKEHFKSFIRDEVSKYIRENFRISVLPRIKKHTELLQQKIIEAAHEASVLVKKNSGDVDLWLNLFTLKLSDVLILSQNDLNGVSHNSVDLNLLEDFIRTELPSLKFDILTTDNFLGKLDYQYKPDEILIDHLCECCWVQCPFCTAICTNTLKDHPGDHSVPFHRNIGLNGWHYRGTTNLSCAVCTSEVASNHSFYPDASDDKKILWKQYKKAGPPYANWSITPDLSELPYWKWFVCKFQKDLEDNYRKTFQGSGEIPNDWKEYNKQDAIESLSFIYNP